MRSILAFADRARPTGSWLETALSLARMVDGHVSILIDTPVAQFIPMDVMGNSYLAADAIREALAHDDACAAQLAEHLRQEDVPFDILRCEDDPVYALSEAARLADVIVVERGTACASQLAVTVRSPVLIAPAAELATFPVATACVAWDGGDEAAAAMRAAVPLLTHCGEVHVLTVQEKTAGFPATDAVRYLSRHGVKAELYEMERAGAVAETLAAAVARLDAGLLVMGAYGRSRMREFLFGGVTRHFLESETAPAVLLAH